MHICISMAAPSDDHNQPQPQINGDEETPERQPPPYGIAVALAEERTPSRQVLRQRTRVRRRPAPSASELSLSALRGCRRMLATLLRWFAARPLGQRALEAVECTLTTAERATVWAGSAASQTPDRQSVPFTWYMMMPIVMALLVIRTGAALAERYLDVKLPGNQELVSWLEGQRTQLEELQMEAAQNIRTQTIDEDDMTHSFLNTWPFNIPYRAAQQLGVIPVRVDQQPSATDSTSMPSLEPATSPSSSETSTLPGAEEHAAASSREVTPSPEPVGDKTMYFSPEGEMQTEEMETEAQKDDEQGNVEDEQVQEEKAAEPPTITAEESEPAVPTALQPEQSSPPHILVEEAEKAAMSVIRPSVPAASSEELLAAEGASGSEPATATATATGTKRRPFKASYKAPKGTPFLNLFGSKLA